MLDNLIHGVLPGFIIGAVVGAYIITRYHNWLVIEMAKIIKISRMMDGAKQRIRNGEDPQAVLKDLPKDLQADFKRWSKGKE